MKLTFIRHTKVNVPPGICYGQTDVPLAESYHEEREIIHNKLENRHFDQVFSSPLNRCRKLSEDLFSSPAIQFDDRLKELNFGEWEMKSWEEIFQEEAGKNWMDNYFEASCPGGESYQQFRDRLVSFFQELKTSSIRNSVIVTHSGIIRLVKSILDHQPMDEVFSSFNPEYGGIYEFKIK